MLFRNLTASSALTLVQYPDIDAFRASEKYVRAESIPLQGGSAPVLRASSAFPSCLLSLVRTFPRIIKGYEMADRLVIVIPMDDVGSARINGRAIGHALVLLTGSANCTVHEPDGRLVAIVSMRRAILGPDWQGFHNGHLLLELAEARLDALRLLLRHLLESAAREPEAMQAPAAQLTAERLLLAELDDVMHSGTIMRDDDHSPQTRYQKMVGEVDHLLRFSPTSQLGSDEIATAMGVSTRTLHNSMQHVCGLSPHRYIRLRRLWMVRSQLRAGTPGLTIKASALAHGFRHMGEFSDAYKTTFGEMPSQTLDCAKRSALLSHRPQ